MPAILIPSKNIYKCQNPKVIDNNFTHINQNVNYSTVNEGNILDREYVFTFYERNAETGDFSKKYLEAENTEGVHFDVNTQGTTQYAEATLSFQISKNAKITIDSDNTLSSHRLKSVKSVSVMGIYTDEITSYEDIKISSYDEVSGIIKFNHKASIRYEPLTTRYVLSERLSIVGDYITMEEQTKETGNGLKLLELETNELVQDKNSWVTDELSYAKITIKSYEYGNIYFTSDTEFESGTVIIYEGENATIKDSFANEYIVPVSEDSKFIGEIGKTVEVSYRDMLNATETVANNILKNYVNGKETVKLLCSISDYSSDTDVVISPNGVKVEIKFDLSSTSLILSLTTVIISLHQTYHKDLSAIIKCKFLINDLIQESLYEIIIEKGTQSKTKTIAFPYASFRGAEVVGITEKLPMQFEISHKVIPMVFGANGKDRPISHYKSGKPKVFEVLGVETIYDGALWQELTLLEVTEEN